MGPIDAFIRLGYRCAYRGLRLYWRLFHPTTHGALVALWHGGKVLLVETSYYPFRSFPGGSVKRHESAQAAARRELAEEIGLRVAPRALREVDNRVHDWAGKHDHVVIFELELDGDRPPPVKVDGREVVSAGFFSPEEALKLPLFPPIRPLIEARQAARNPR